MVEKFVETVLVKEQKQIAAEIFDMWLDTEQIAGHAKAGQFISLYCRDGSRLLPRPISICEINEEKTAVRIVYRVAGKGTEEFSRLRAKDQVTVMGPLGNGFSLDRGEDKKVFLIGGGIGIPPMLQLAKELKADKQIILGYRDELFLNHELQQYGKVALATEDGSAGVKGNVLDVICRSGWPADVIYACGPTPMLRALQEFAAKHNIECWLSLEERMACGIGACLACVCRSQAVDHHTNVHNKRICKDGPVFLAEEVKL